MLEYRGCRVAKEQFLTWPAVHAHHDQIAAVTLGLPKNGLIWCRGADYGRSDLLAVQVTKLDDIVKDRALMLTCQNAPPALLPVIRPGGRNVKGCDRRVDDA